MAGLALAAAVSGCAGSSGPSAAKTAATPKVSTEGCYTAADAEVTFHNLAQGMQDKTVTVGDAVKGFASVAKTMGGAADIASGPLQSATRNASVVAGRLRVALVNGNTRFDTARAVGVLRADVGRIDSICSPG